MNKEPYRLIISGDTKTVRAIINRLCEQYPNLAIKEYLNLYDYRRMVLV